MKNIYGMTPMMTYTSDLLECVKIMAELPGRDISIKVNNGCTALEVAELHDPKEIVKYLVDTESRKIRGQTNG
jgi:hypothetical protein